MDTNLDQPIDIIVTTSNCLRYLKSCLDSINKYTTDIPYRLIVVDNGSTDGTKEFLAGLQSKKFVVKRNESNPGNPKALLQGYNISTSDLVCVVNDDVVVSPKWLSQLVKVMNDNPDVGILGPVRPGAFFTHPCTRDLSKIVLEESKKKYKTPNGQLKYFTHGMEYTSFVNDYKKANGPSITRFREIPDIVSTCCAVVRRKAIDEVGGISDQRFKKYGGEDTDLCWRLIKAGYSLAVTSKAYIHHFEHISMTKNKVDRQKYLKINSRRLYKKWKDDINEYLIQKINAGLTNEQILQKSWLLNRLADAVGKSFWPRQVKISK